MHMIRRWVLPFLIGGVVTYGAWHATLLATPFALMHAAMTKIGARGPENQFAFGALATAANQPIVRPSPDLLYSTCVFDVSKGPLLVDVEPVPGTYWSVSVFDARTDVATVLSDRDTSGKSARLLLHRDDFQVEFTPGYTHVPLKYSKGILLIRILLTDQSRFAEADAIRRKARCRLD
jgi:uncharacterized membrane protein